VKGLEWGEKGREQNILLKAIAEFEQAVALDPSHTMSWLQLIRFKLLLVFFKQQPLDKYQTGLKEHLAVLSDGHPQWAADLANGIYQYHALGNYEKGFNYFKQVLEHQPDNEMANAFISYIYRRRLDVKRSYQHLTKAIQLNQKELRTINQAVAIVDEVRERLRSEMGEHEYDMSELYTLNALDLHESDGQAEWIL
jgi:tetratricopeptide (TPR) repeat protein